MESLDLLRKLLAEKICLVGIGNHLRGDDGFGPYFIEKIREKSLLPEENLMTVEDVPENYAFPISRKDVGSVVFVDAVILEAPPGTVVLGPLEELEEVGQIASTHKLSLRLTARVIEEAGKRVYLLGMVPETMEFGRELSPKIRRVTDELVGLLEGMIKDLNLPGAGGRGLKPTGRKSQ
ncbi:MAG: hydrogenase maturation protease [Candidatus Saccharicenans sp.]|nr:hydrogenase maturation protease [Candidatus Saccharicenans sp.]MDI6849139.1 hydrogenase maturation protease [Candidatus Saccharicenans sp.]